MWPQKQPALLELNANTLAHMFGPLTRQKWRHGNGAHKDSKKSKETVNDGFHRRMRTDMYAKLIIAKLAKRGRARSRTRYRANHHNALERSCKRGAV